MNSPEIRKYIKKYSHLFWHIPANKKKDISEDLLVETVLNYGSWDAIKSLFNTIGLEKTARIFYGTINSSERRKRNYHELTLNFFTLYFKRHAPRSS
jgi:hypothetical protein